MALPYAFFCSGKIFPGGCDANANMTPIHDYAEQGAYLKQNPRTWDLEKRGYYSLENI